MSARDVRWTDSGG